MDVLQRLHLQFTQHLILFQYITPFRFHKIGQLLIQCLEIGLGLKPKIGKIPGISPGLLPFRSEQRNHVFVGQQYIEF